MSGKRSGGERGRPSGQGLPVPPSQRPLQGNGVGRAVALFREEKREPREVGSLRLVVPASSEPRGPEPSTGAAVTGLRHVLCLAVGGRGSRAFPRIKATLAVPSPSSTRPQGPAECPTSSGVTRLLIQVGVKPGFGRCSSSCEKHPPRPPPRATPKFSALCCSLSQRRADIREGSAGSCPCL